MAERDSDGPAGPTVQDVVQQGGLTVDPLVDDVMRQAAAGQGLRLSLGASDRAAVTRSTAIWALMTVDPGVRETLESAGLDLARWAAILNLATPPPPADSPDAPIDGDFHNALAAFLDSDQAIGSIGTVDIARAIARSARGTGPDDSGLVGRRFSDLGVDPGSLDGALLASFFSASVRAIREAMTRQSPVTATQIARELQVKHGHYGDGLFAGITWPSVSEQEATRSVDEWLALVRAQYDTAAVARTRHQVLDGELLLLGLERLDPTLSDALRENGCLEAIERAVDIQPPNPPDRTTRDGTQLTSDDVRDLDCDAADESDYLGRRYLAEALALRLRFLTTAPQTFIIHVDGPWGSGKSTLFKLLKCKLASQYLVVEVNAWRDQQVGIQWWTLHNALRAAVIHAGKHPWVESAVLWFGEIKSRLAAFVGGILVILTVLFGVALLTKGNLKESGDLADSMGKVIALVVLGFTGVTALSRYLVPASGRSARGFVEKSSNPMEQVQRLFERTLQRAGRPVVFLIDDLDRCEQAYVLEFLEVLQTLVRPAIRTVGKNGKSRAGPFAIIAADGQWLRACYESHFDETRLLPVPGRTLGYLFLEKIFQLQIRLPSVSDEAKTAFYESLLRINTPRPEPTPEDERRRNDAEDLVKRARTGEDINDAAQSAMRIRDHRARTEVLGRAALRLSEQSVAEGSRHELSKFAPLLDANPRSIRLFVNSFGMLQTLRTLEGTRVATTPLALWTIVEVRWPMLADHLRRHPDDISIVPDPGGEATEMQRLLLNPEVQRVINSQEWGPLSPTLVRQCTGELRS